MPYGTAKARTGDPAQWITDKLETEFTRMVPQVGEDDKKDNKGFTDKEIRMAFGILNDPRYKGGNYDGAYRAIQKIAYGVADHPSVAKALRRANEAVLGFMAPGKNPQPKFKDRDSKVGVKTYDKPKDAKEPYFKKEKNKK